MRLPPKMPQRAMVRIWVASHHQKTSTYTNTLRFLFCPNLKFHPQGWIRTAAATSLKTAQKQPSGLFLAARLAISTRAHQKNQRRKYAGFLFYLPEPDDPMITSFSPSATSRLTSFKTRRSPKYFSTCSSLITLHSPFPVSSLPQGRLALQGNKKDALRSLAKRLCL